MKGFIEAHDFETGNELVENQPKGAMNDEVQSDLQDS